MSLIDIYTAFSNSRKQKRQRRSPNKRPATPPLKRRKVASDYFLVELVNSYQMLTQDQLQALTEKGRSATQHTLRRLYDTHVLNRVLLYTSVQGNPRAFYIVDRIGKEMLHEQGHEQVRLINPDTVSAATVAHTSELNSIRISITAESRERGWQIPYWFTDLELRALKEKITIMEPTGKVVTLPVEQDAAFGIEQPGLPPVGFLLEYDRSTMTIERYIQKVRAMVAYHKTGDYQARYGTNSMKVLTIVTRRQSEGERRLKNLLKATAQVPGIGRRFWFTTLAAFNDTKPLTEPIWRIAGAEATPAALFSPS
jgi:hypothetical protein